MHIDGTCTSSLRHHKLGLCTEVQHSFTCIIAGPVSIAKLLSPGLRHIPRHLVVLEPIALLMGWLKVLLNRLAALAHRDNVVQRKVL